MDNTADEDIILNDKHTSLNDLYANFGGRNYRVDLGCGYVKPDGFIGIDNLIGKDAQTPDEENAPDILMNLNTGLLPFDDNSCEVIRSSHFLEHSNIPHILDESFRVLQPNGSFQFVVPYANSAEGMYPGHHVFLTEKWFYKNIQFQKLFKIESEEYFPSDYWLELPGIVRFLIPFKFARTFLFNTCWQMSFVCSVKK